jgi:hypothetical protein
MEKQVIYRDRQELQSADLNAVEAYTADSLQHLTKDAVTAALAYTGGLAAAASATEITVAPLRFYSDGRGYVSETAQTLNLFQYLPLVTRKIVAVVVWGEEVDTNVEPRDFLIDLTTGATQPSAVAMQRLRAANINLLPGAESADPQPPVIQTGTLAIAYIYLTPTGIDYIEMQSAPRLPQLADHAQRGQTLEVWKGLAAPRISSIATDLAGLASKTDDKADRASIVALANDIAKLKESLVVGTAAVAYTPNYGDATQADAAGAGYSARVEDAILFDYAASATLNLALFNPIDPSVKVASDGLTLPAYTSVPRVATEGYAGDVAIAGYQVQAATVKKFKASDHSRHYGPHANHHAKWYARHGWDAHGKDTDFTLETYGYRKITPKDIYALEATTTAISGALLAQTVLVSNAMWLTRVGLSFTAVAATGDVTVAITETLGGKPQLGQALALVTVPQASLLAYPAETTIDVPPVLLSPGKRYAVVVISQGDHRLALVAGGPNTQGKLFYGQDGDYNGYNGNNDLLFSLYGAQFASTRSEVMLQALALSGGMNDIQIVAPHVLPKGCEFHYEIQPTGAGAWYKLGDSTLRLSTSPNLVNLRAVFTGTSDLAPAVVLTNNAVTVSRPNTASTWWSGSRTVPSTTSIVLSALVSAWDGATHTLTPKIVIGGTEYAASVTTSTTEDGATRFKYSFTVPATTTYKIKLTGTRTAGSNPFAVVELIDAVN